MIEDDEAIRRPLHLMLQSEGFEVRSFAGIGALLADLKSQAAGFLVTDYQLRDGDGIDMLRAMRRSGWQGRAVLITGCATDSLRAAASASGFHRIIEKPLRHYELLRALAN